MTMPVFINVYNRSSTTIKLADQVARLGGDPILIDNNSDWEPLLDWYSTCPYRVVRLQHNLGHLAPWTSGVVAESKAEFYAVSDCDLDLDGVPDDAFQRLLIPFTWRNGIIKSGFSLRIDDLPPWQHTVKRWESRFWTKRTPCGQWYYSPIDTTFAVRERKTPHDIATRVVGVRSVRSAITIRHVPWYLDGNNLDEENAHYFATANGSNSWRPNGRGLTASYAR